MAKEAGPYEFIRRASYDLWGLPPKPKEVEVFVQSFEKDPLRAKVELVDRLLADSRLASDVYSWSLDRLKTTQESMELNLSNRGRDERRTRTGF